MTRAGRRGHQTRARIAEAAGALFAARGYERTTIRAIAERAAVDPAMVMRHFGSKEGLFAAVSAFDLRLPDLAKVPRNEVGPTVAELFVMRLRTAEGEGLLRLLRAASSNEAARATIRELFRRQVVAMVAGIVRDPQEAERRGALLASQIIGLVYCRSVIGLPPLAEAEPAALRHYLVPLVEAILLAPASGAHP